MDLLLLKYLETALVCFYFLAAFYTLILLFNWSLLNKMPYSTFLQSFGQLGFSHPVLGFFNLNIEL